MVEAIRGLVRPICAFVIVGTMAYLFIAGRLDPNDVLPIAGMILAFYFAERAISKNLQKTGEKK